MVPTEPPAGRRMASRSGARSGGRLEVVVLADGGQQPVGSAFADAQPRLRRQLAAAPADAVVLDGADHRVGVAGAKRGAEAADDVSRQVRRRAEDGGPGVLAAPVDLPLAAVGAEYHRTVVAGFGDDGHRPELFLPVPG